jgi:phosphohistidine phosphatase
MARHGFLPDQVLCSAARRAVETWQAVSTTLGVEVPTEFREDLYHAAPGDLLDAVRDLPPQVRSVLVIGHNPAFEDLALALAGSGEENALRELDRKYPTGAMAVLDFPVEDWTEVREGTGWLRAFLRPKDLK